jgi:tellurite resistance protein TerC
MSPETLWWVGFNGFVVAMLVLDLGVFHRKAHAVRMPEAIAWSCVWVGLALLFNLGIYLGWFGPFDEAQRGQAALEFLTGYVVELSLSVDNVFVFALLFTYFHVPPNYRHRVLFWGILGAVVMRAGMIILGIGLLNRFHWIMYVFGFILLASGVKMWLAKNEQIDPERNPVLKLVRRLFPVSTGDHGQKFFVREHGRLAVTPLFIVLVFIEWSDLVFAIDSIPAVLAVTKDPFIAYTSNVMAILGLRSFYFALAGVMEKFHHLHYGLSAILVFVGAKMLLIDLYHVPTFISLAVISTILVASVIASFIWPSSAKDTSPAAGVINVGSRDDH